MKRVCRLVKEKGRAGQQRADILSCANVIFIDITFFCGENSFSVKIYVARAEIIYIFREVCLGEEMCNSEPCNPCLPQTTTMKEKKAELGTTSSTDNVNSMVIVCRVFRTVAAIIVVVI